MKHHSDLSLARLGIILGFVGLSLVFVFKSEDIIQWKDFSKWTRAGNFSSSFGIGDPSCLSKSHQHRYRAKMLLPPSQELQALWEKYVAVHGSCSKDVNWSQILMNASAATSSCKYLIYIETGEGLGNRILSLVSALLYALITDRVLLLDSRKDVGKILCEPFNGSSWLLPSDFPYELVKNGPDLGQAIRSEFKQVPLVRLQLAHVQSPSDQLFFCNHIQRSLESVRVVAWSSNQYYVTSFFKVPFLWSRLTPLFGSRLDVFAQLAGLAIFPANSVWSLISRYYDSYLSCSRRLVGVQIRPHSRPNLAEYDPAVYQVVLDCLNAHVLRPNFSISSATQPVQLYQKHKADVSVLVASLQGKYYESLRSTFLLPNGTEKVVNVHTLSSEGAEHHTLRQASLALAEMWLLSFSGEILISEFSTFGYIANGLVSKRPLVMRTRGTRMLNVTSEDGCYLNQSTEPCTHFPQRPQCPGDVQTQEHLEWIEANIGMCQDQPGGWLLLNH